MPLVVVVGDVPAVTETETVASTGHSAEVAVVDVVPLVTVVVGEVVVLDEVVVVVGKSVGRRPPEDVVGFDVVVDVELDVVVLLVVPKVPEVGHVVEVVVSVVAGVVSRAPPSSSPMHKAVSETTTSAESRAGVFMVAVESATVHILTVTPE